jgi:GTPase
MSDTVDLGALARVLPPESDDGNREYKRLLVGVSDERFEELTTQLKWRCHEGDGEALYELGVSDDGEPVGLTESECAESLETLIRMAKEIDATCSTACERRTKDGKRCVTVLVRENFETTTHKEIRITTLGNVDSGKSTILGVLTRGGLDNGRGLARGGVFRHKHEIESGRTSSISSQIMGFANDGSVINYHNPEVREAHQLRWDQIVSAAAKVIHFSDLCGHEKYLRTTMHGVAGTLPDFALMCVDANRGGIIGMTKEHLSILLGLKVPFFVLVTKVDMASPENLAATLDALTKMLKRPGTHKTPFIVRDELDVITSVKNISGGIITPIFQVSCVSGQGLDLVRKFLNHIPARRMLKPLEGDRALVHLDDSFTVQGIGTVVSGLVVSGKVDTHASMLLGPDGNGEFVPVLIKSVQNKRVAVESVAYGNTASFAIRPKKGHIHKHEVRKGMILCDVSVNPRATWQFQAEVLILAHPTTLKVGYNPILHCVTVRQAARIMSIEGKDVMRMGDRALVTFEWSHRPEYVSVGTRIIFREGRTRGIGVIRFINPDVSRTPFRNYKTQTENLGCDATTAIHGTTVTAGAA